MAVTVGIATTGEDPPVLRRTVEGVIRSAAAVSADAEVLVVVNGRDRVPELSTVDSSLLRVIYQPRRNVAVARNAVLSEARHDTILFTDDDCAVPVEWCHQLTEALRDPGHVAVGAPVRVNVAGPISAYFDNLRKYDAVPGAPGGPLLLVTANCGLRRDRIPASIRFDPALNSAGEDTGLSLALGKAGLRARWLADASPIWHRMSEDIEEITNRFMRNARHGLYLFLGHGHGDAAMPGALDLYRRRVTDGSAYLRRFSEFVAPQARTAFAVYESIAAAVAMIGYLDRLGSEWDTPLLDLDPAGLAARWHEIGQRVSERAAGLSAAEWADLAVDYAGMAARVNLPEPLLDKVTEALAECAPPRADPVGPLDDLLNHGSAQAFGSFLDGLERTRAAFDELLASGAPVTPEVVDRRMREVGYAFTIACDMVESSMRIDFRPLIAARRSAAWGPGLWQTGGKPAAGGSRRGTAAGSPR